MTKESERSERFKFGGFEVRKVEGRRSRRPGRSRESERSEG